MRSLHRILPVIGFSLLILAHPGPVSAAKEPAAVAPPARVLSSLDLPGELQWYYQNDVGMLVVYAGGRLHRFDLLAAGTEPLEAAAFPEVSRTRSVAPVPGTGLLLISDAAGGALDGTRAGASSSYAFDTLGGRMLWEAKPLPPPARVFSFPDAGTAVLWSFEGGGSLTAIDLRTGSRVWSLAMPIDASFWRTPPPERPRSAAIAP